MAQRVDQQLLQVLSGDKEAAAKASYRTVFKSILDSDLEEEEKLHKRVLDEAVAVVGAGVLTSAHFLKVATFHLLDNPDILKKLKAELQEAIPNPKTIPSLPELEKLPYMHTIIQEIYRISHGVSHRLQRVSPDLPLVYQEWVIPPGTPCSMTSVMLHDNPEIFPEPHEFRPDRWADQAEERRLSKYLVNFSRGTRRCIGMELAVAEIHLTMVTVFRRFNFELFETDCSDVDMKHDYFIPLPELDTKGVRVLVY